MAWSRTKNKVLNSNKKLRIEEENCVIPQNRGAHVDFIIKK